MKIITILFMSVLTFVFTGCFDSKEDKVKFYGNVDVRTVSLAFRVSGRIENINFDEGQKVKKGDVIAKLDDSLYKEYLNQVEANIAVQKANIAKLEKGYRVEEIKKAEAKLLQSTIEKDRLQKEFQRINKLFKEHSVSEQDFDNAKAAFNAAKANAEFAKNSLEMLQNGYEKEDILSAKANLEALIAQRNLHKINLDDTKLISPTDGTILTRVYEVGSIVNAAQPIVEMAKDNEYWVRSYMSEKYLGLIKTGLEATVHTDIGKEYKGKVSFISPLAEFTPKTVQTEELRTDLVYRFRVVLDQYDESVRQGMPVTITFDDIELEE